MKVASALPALEQLLVGGEEVVAVRGLSDRDVQRIIILDVTGCKSFAALSNGGTYRDVDRSRIRHG